MEHLFFYLLIFALGFLGGWGWSRLKPAQRAAVTDKIANEAERIRDQAIDIVKK